MSDDRITKVAEFFGTLAQAFSAASLMSETLQNSVVAYGRAKKSFEKHQAELDKQLDLMEAKLHATRA